MKNPSFEMAITCPTSVSGACMWFNDVLGATCADWHNLGCGSADYFNSCNNSINGSVGVPLNNAGYQLARTGSAYIGIMSSFSTTCRYREYATSMLSDTLVSNEKYYVEFYVNPANQNTSDAFGALFSNGEPDTAGFTNQNCFYIMAPSQINNPTGNFISNISTWTRVSGTFYASGGENYITIGNFSDTLTYHGGGYYYIDDVFVIPDSVYTNDYSISNNYIELGPNPFNNFIQLSTNWQGKMILMLFNSYGQLIYNMPITTDIQIDLSNFGAGLYSYNIYSNLKSIKTGRIIKLN